MTTTCPACREPFDIATGQYNRAIGRGYLPACSRACGAEDRKRRRPRTTPEYGSPEYAEWKAEYDRQRRIDKGEAWRRQRAEQTRENYYANHDVRLARMAELRADPEYRAQMAAYQREHNARPEWKAHKRQYDRQYRAARDYGEEMAPAVVALLALDDAIAEMVPNRHDIYAQRGTSNKSQRRKRRAGR